MPNWTITIEPRGETYIALVQAACAKGVFGGLVAQDFQSWDASFASFMAELARHTVSVEKTHEWPGTVQGIGNKESLQEGCPRLHKFLLNQDVAHLLTSYA